MAQSVCAIMITSGFQLSTVRQHLAAISCSLSVAITSTAFVWYAPLLLYIVSPESEVPMTTTETSWLISSMELGCLFFVIPAGIIGDSFLIFMPESPYYLIMKGRHEEAKQALTWLRGGKEVNEELKEIEETIEREIYEQGSWKDLFHTKKDRMAFFIVQICSVTKYMGGMPAFANYVSQTFGESTIRYLDNDQLTIVTGVLLAVSTFSSSLLSISIGRRPILIYSCFCCFIFPLIIGGYYFLDFETAFDVSPYVWVLYVSVIAFIIAANVGVGPLLQTIQAEFFTARTRGIGGALTLVVGSSATFLSIKQYQFIQDTVGVYLNYWIWAAVSLIGAICMFFFLPETAGRSLGEIQKDMKNAYQTDI